MQCTLCALCLGGTHTYNTVTPKPLSCKPPHTCCTLVHAVHTDLGYFCHAYDDILP